MAGRGAAAGLDTVFLAAPTSPDERLRRVAADSRGFVYAVSRTGVTGERDAISADARPLLARLRDLSDVPVALGFGHLHAGAGAARRPRWRTAWWWVARWCASWRSTPAVTWRSRRDG